MINTLRDRLMLDSFDRFRNLINEINDLKAEFKKQRRRVKPDLGVVISSRKLLDIASPLNKIFNGKRYSEQTSIEMLCQALNKLSLLVRELTNFDCQKLADTFQYIYNRLFVLLPENTALQPQLFDADKYDPGSKKPTPTNSFLNWLQDYKIFSCQRRDLARRTADKPIQLVQHSIKLVYA